MLRNSHTRLFIGLALVLIICFLGSLLLGSVMIPVDEVMTILGGGKATKSSWEFIIWEYRIPKAITAMMAGGGLAVSGLLMQTLFRNPLAGPFVLGISSGASLGVAFLLLGAGTFAGFLGGLLAHSWSIVIASALGSFLVLLAVLAVSLRVKDTMALLIIGLMFGSITSAVVAVLAYFSNAEQLQQYIFWSFGSLGNTSWNALKILSICLLLGMLLALRASKWLNAMLLGENYAKSLGVQLQKSTLIIVVATSILAGSITAFVGPIAFVGLAVPHITRQWVKTSNHLLLVPAIFISGAILMLLCDALAQIPFSDFILPINAVTSIIGAPVVIWLLVRKRKLIF